MAVYYTYMVVCKDCTLYTGYTNDLVRRMRKHNSGKGAKYTRSRLPVRLVYWEKYASKQQAMQREYAIKQWTRQQSCSCYHRSSDSKFLLWKSKVSMQHVRQKGYKEIWF